MTDDTCQQNLSKSMHSKSLLLLLLLGGCHCVSGRVLAPAAPARSPLQQLEAEVERLREAFSGVLRKRHTEADAEAQPAFAGSWRSGRTEGLDEFLERSMGVGYLKRKVASQATQTQRLRQTGRGGGAVIHLELCDKRGTSRYQIRPDGKERAGRGFQKLPIRQTARMKDGALLVEEKYSQALGGEDHGAPCTGSACPVVRSRRWVEGGEMLVQLERTLPSGEVIGMTTWYARCAPSAARKPRQPRPRQHPKGELESPLAHLDKQDLGSVGAKTHGSPGSWERRRAARGGAKDESE